MTSRRRVIGYGLSHYANILAQLRGTPSTASRLALAMGADDGSMRTILRQMRQAGGIVHISGWVRERGILGGIHTAVWCFGNKPDVPAPVGRQGRSITTMRPLQRPITKDLRNFCAVWQALSDVPASIPDLMQMTGVHRETLRKLVIQMRDLGLVRIACWDTNYRVPVAHYKLGCSSDAPRPKPLARAEIRQQRIERQRSRERVESLLASRSPFDLMASQLAGA